jgi:outer membrane protein OmpA-like peptidoglycan-associated protein
VALKLHGDRSSMLGRHSACGVHGKVRKSSVRTLARLFLLAAIFLHPTAASATGPPLLFFDTGSAHLGPTAAATLDYAAEWLRGAHAELISIEASADRVGSAAANRRLARRRGETVKAALVRRGFRADQIIIKAFGESRPLIETPDDVPEPQNRFAMIFIERMTLPSK